MLGDTFKNIYTQNNFFFFIKDLFSFNNFDPFFLNNFFFYSNINACFYLNSNEKGDYYTLFNRDFMLSISKTQLPVELQDVVRVELKGISRLLGTKNLDIDSKLFSQLTNTSAEQKIQDYSTFFDTKKSFNFDIYLHIRDYLLNNISLYDLELEQSWLKDSYLYDVTHHLSIYKEDIPSVIYNNVLDYDLSTNTPIILRYSDDCFFFESENSAESLIRLATQIHKVDLDNSVLYTKLRWILSTFFSKDSNNYLNLTLNHFHKHKYNSEYMQALYSAFFKDLHLGNLAVINRDISSIFNNLDIEYNGSDVDRSFFTLYLGLDRDVDEDVFLSFFLPEYKFFSYKEGEFYLDEIMDASGKIMDTEKKRENFAFSNLLWPEQVDRNFRDVKTRFETIAFDQRGLRDFSLYFHSDLIECLSFMPIWVLYYLMFSSDVVTDVNSYIKLNARPLKHFHRNAIDPDSILGYQWMGSWLTLVPKWYWDRFDPKFIITIAGDNVFINNYWLYDLWLKNTGQSGIFSNTSYFSIFNIAFGSHFIYNFGIFWYYILLLFSIPIFILWFLVLFLSELDRNTFNFYLNWPQNARFLSELNNNKIKFKNRFKLLTIDEVFLFLFEGKGLSSAFPIIKFLVKFHDYFFIKPLNKFIFKFNKLFINKFIYKLNAYKKNLFIYLKDVCYKLMALDSSLNFYVWKEQLNNHFFFKNKKGNNPFIFFNNRSLFFIDFYDYYYSITKFLKYFAVKEGYINFFVKVHVNNRIAGTGGFNWSVLKKNTSFFLDWFPSWLYSVTFEVQAGWGKVFYSKNIDYSTLINYYKFNINNNFYLNLFSNYLNFYFYQLNKLSFNSIFNNFYSNLKIFYINYKVESSVLDLNIILSRIKSFSSLIFRDINKKNKALFFDINFKSNTLLLSNKHTTFGYSFAQLIKTRLDFFFIKSNYINNNNTYRNSFNGVFKFKNNLSFSTYLALVYTQNKKLLLDRRWVSWYPYEDFYAEHFDLITNEKSTFIKNLKYPIEGSPLDFGVYNTVNITKGLRFLLTYKNNLKYFIYEDKLPLMLKRKNLIFSQVWRMRAYQLRIAKVLINILNIQLTLNSPKQLNSISSILHKTKTGRFFRKSIINHRTAFWNDRLMNLKSLFWWKTWFLHQKIKYNPGMQVSPLMIRNLFFLGRTNFRLSNFLYLEQLSNKIKIYNFLRRKNIVKNFNYKFFILLWTNPNLLRSNKLAHKYPKIFFQYAQLLDKYPKLLNKLLINEARRWHYPFLEKEYVSFRRYIASAKKLKIRYVHPFIFLSNKAYVSELNNSFINQQNIFNSKIFNSLNYSSSILNLLEKKVLNFSNMVLTLDKVNFISFNVSNSFERIHLYFNMLNHIFSIIEKSFLYPLMGNILSINTEISGYLLRKFILKLNNIPTKNKWLKGSPLLSLNHLFGEYPWFLIGKSFTEWNHQVKNQTKFSFSDLQSVGSLNTHFLLSGEKTSNYFFSFTKFIEYLTAFNDKFLIHNNLTEVYGKSTSYFLLKISDIIQHWVVFIDKKISLILDNFNDVFYNQKFYNNIILNNISNLNLNLNKNIINSTKSLFYKINFKFCFDIFTFYIKDLKLMDVFKNLHSLNYSNLINLITNYLYFPTLNNLNFNNFSSIFLRWNSIFFVDKFIDINYFNSFIFAPQYRVKSDWELITFFNENKLNIKLVLNVFKFNDFLKKLVLSPDFVPLRYLIYTGFFEEFFLFSNSLGNSLMKNRSSFVRPFFFHPEGAYSVLSNKYTETLMVENKPLNFNTFNLSLVDVNPIEIDNNNLALILYDTKNQNYKLISQNNNNLIELDFLNKEEKVLLQENLNIQQKSESRTDSDLVGELNKITQYTMPIKHLFSESLLIRSYLFTSSFALDLVKQLIVVEKLGLEAASAGQLPGNFDFKKGELAIEELANSTYTIISELDKKREDAQWCTLENVITFYREALVNKIFPIYLNLFPETCLCEPFRYFRDNGDFRASLAFLENYWVSKFMPGNEENYFVDPRVLNFLSEDLKNEWISFVFVKELFDIFFCIHDDYNFVNSFSLFYDVIEQINFNSMGNYLAIFKGEKVGVNLAFKPRVYDFILDESTEEVSDVKEEEVLDVKEEEVLDVKEEEVTGESSPKVLSLMLEQFFLDQQKMVNDAKLGIHKPMDEQLKLALDTGLNSVLLTEEEIAQAKAASLKQGSASYVKHYTLEGEPIYLIYTTLDNIVLFDDNISSNLFLRIVQTKFRRSQENFIIKNNKNIDKTLITDIWKPAILNLSTLSSNLHLELNEKRVNEQWCNLANVIHFYRYALINKILPIYINLLPEKHKCKPLNLLTILLNFYTAYSKETGDLLYLDTWVFAKNLYYRLIYRSTTNQIWSMYEFLLNSIMKKPNAYAYLMGVKFVEEAPITKSVGVFLDELETKPVFDLLEDKISLFFISTKTLQLEFISPAIDFLYSLKEMNSNGKQVFKKAFISIAEVSFLVQKKLNEKRVNEQWCTLENVITFYSQALVDEIFPIYIDLIDIKYSAMGRSLIFKTIKNYFSSDNDKFKIIKNLFYKLIISSEKLSDFSFPNNINLLNELLDLSDEAYNTLLKEKSHYFVQIEKFYDLFEEKIPLEFLLKKYVVWPSFISLLVTMQVSDVDVWMKAHIALVNVSYNIQKQLHDHIDNLSWYKETDNVFNFYKFNLINNILPIYLSLYQGNVPNSNAIIEALLKFYVNDKINSFIFIKNLFYRLLYRSRYDSLTVRLDLLTALFKQRLNALSSLIGDIPEQVKYLYEDPVCLYFLKNKRFYLSLYSIIPEEGLFIQMQGNALHINKSIINTAINKLAGMSLMLFSQLEILQHDSSRCNFNSVFLFYFNNVNTYILPIYLNLLGLDLESFTSSISFFQPQLNQTELFIFYKNLFYKFLFKSINDNFLLMFSLFQGLVNKDKNAPKVFMSIPDVTTTTYNFYNLISLQEKNKVENYYNNWLLQYSNIVNFLNETKNVFKDFKKSLNNTSILDFKFLSYDYKISNYRAIYEELLKKNSFWLALDVDVMTLHENKTIFRLNFLIDLHNLLASDSINFVTYYIGLTNDKFLQKLYFKFLSYINYFYNEERVTGMCEPLTTCSRMVDFLLMIYNQWFNIFSHILSVYRKNIKEEVELLIIWHKFLFKLSLFCQSFFSGKLRITPDRNINDDLDYFNIIVTSTYWYKICDFNNWYLTLKKFSYLFLNELPVSLKFDYIFHNDCSYFFKEYGIGNKISYQDFSILLYNFLLLNGIEISNLKIYQKGQLLSIFLFSGLKFHLSSKQCVEDSRDNSS